MIWSGSSLNMTYDKIFSTTTFTNRVVTAANIYTAVNHEPVTALSALITS